MEYSMATLMRESDRTYAYGLGSDRPNVAWILSDRDVWYANPCYIGPKVGHPEDYADMDDWQIPPVPAFVSSHKLYTRATGEITFGVLPDGTVDVNGTNYDRKLARQLYRALLLRDAEVV